MSLVANESEWTYDCDRLRFTIALLVFVLMVVLAARATPMTMCRPVMVFRADRRRSLLPGGNWGLCPCHRCDPNRQP